MKFYYICAGGQQCHGPQSKFCYKGCRYTSNFFLSRIYHESIKPSKPVDFIQDKRGDYWEVNWDWDKNLPDAFRKKPEKIISKTYTDISQEEVYLHLMKGAVKPSNDPNIPL